MNRPQPAPAWALEARNVAKAFPGVQALAGVSLQVAPGEVHALVGENGAGKSTLMRILAGLEQPDAGQLLVEGREVRLRHPHDALALGIKLIPQEALPFPELTVAENIFMGIEPGARWPGFVDHARLRRESAVLLERLGARLSPDRPMKELRVAEMQMVEIARALAWQARVLVLDEPASALSALEVQSLFGMLGELAARGVAMVYTTHRLDEVFRIAQSVTVLRDGRQVARQALKEVTRDRLIALMVGREIGERVAPAGSARGEAVLRVRGLGRAGRFREVTLEVRAGEVLGLAGLMGAGRTSLLHALYGLEPADAGEVFLEGARVRLRSPSEALARGIACVGEDRRGQGLVLGMSVKRNLTLANLREYCRWGCVAPSAEDRAADGQIRELGIRTPGRDHAAGFLSGGNQQKVVLGKALLTRPRVLLLDEPTRGIDVGAKAEVHASIQRLAEAGLAIVLASSELPELLALSHRLLVLREGAVAAELDPARATQEDILRHAMPLQEPGGRVPVAC